MEVLTKKAKYLERNNTDFYLTLRRRIREYFKDQGTTKYANTLMVVKTIFWIGLFWACYFLILFGEFSKPIMLLLAMVFGFAMLCISLNVGHDASHNSYSRNRKLNRVLSYVFEMIGASSYLWDIMHNKSHHSYINVHVSDVAIDADPFLRLSYDAPRRSIHRFQHIYGLFVYGLATLFWVVWKDFKYIMRPRIGQDEVSGHPTSVWISIFITKIVYFTYMMVIPLMVLDISFGEWLLTFVLIHFVMGITLALTFQTTHAVEETLPPRIDDDRNIHNSWAVHTLEATSDYQPDSFILNWCFGGLNTHVAHHMFPDVCHIHYPAITRIIRATAEEYGMRYVENKNMLSALISHLKHLRNLGREEKSPHPDAVVYTTT